MLLCLLFCLPLLSVLFSLLVFSFLVEVRLFVFVLLSAMRVLVSLCVLRARASCCCSCRGGGFFGVGGYVCCGVCVFSSASPCFKESPIGAPLCIHCLLLLLFVPSSCFLSICLLFVVLVFVFDARARVATANFGLKLNVLLRRSPGDSSPSARLLLALCSTSPPLCLHG